MADGGATTLFIVLSFVCLFLVVRLMEAIKQKKFDRENEKGSTRRNAVLGRKLGLSIFASLAVMLSVIWIARRPPHQEQQPGQTGPDWKSTAPADQSAVPPGGKAVPAQLFVPQAQQGIDPAQVTTTLEIETNPDTPAFIPDSISVKSNEIVKIVFKNMSQANHYDNFVLVQPDKEQDVGEAGLEAGPGNGYIPNMPDEIIAYARTIPPGGIDTLIFRAPSKTGKYPYISTAPRRWKAMNGVLEVK